MSKGNGQADIGLKEEQLKDERQKQNPPTSHRENCDHGRQEPNSKGDC